MENTIKKELTQKEIEEIGKVWKEIDIYRIEKEYPEIIKDKELLLQLLPYNPYVYKTLDINLKLDKSIAFTSAIYAEYNIQNIDSSFRNNKEFLIDVIKIEPNIYYYIDNKDKNNLEIAEKALMLKPNLYLLSNEEIKQNENIILTVIESNKKIFSSIPKEYIKNITGNKDSTIEELKEKIISNQKESYKDFEFDFGDGDSITINLKEPIMPSKNEILLKYKIKPNEKEISI